MADDGTMDDLRDVMNRTQDEGVRSEIKRLIDKIDRM